MFLNDKSRSLCVSINCYLLCIQFKTINVSEKKEFFFVVFEIILDSKRGVLKLKTKKTGLRSLPPKRKFRLYKTKDNSYDCTLVSLFTFFYFKLNSFPRLEEKKIMHALKKKFISITKKNLFLGIY